MDNRKTLNLNLYSKIYLVRRCEQAIIRHYHENEMKTPMHMSMGEEAIVVGICKALGEQSQVFGTYRSHALYLAKTEDIYDFFAEMYGKAGAFLKGKGGSMHLCAPHHGFMGTSAIVGSIIPVACGTAFANQQAGNNKITAVFFGDGAIDEGVFWESLNFASLKKLPLILVCEDNDLAVHSPKCNRHGYDDIAKVCAKFNCKVFSESTTDAERIYKITHKAINHITKEGGPVFMHFKYYRYLEHVGVREDFDAGYRAKAEFKQWEKIDPVKMARKKLKQIGFSEGNIRQLEKDIDEKVEAGLARAQNDSHTNEDVLYKEVM